MSTRVIFTVTSLALVLHSNITATAIVTRQCLAEPGDPCASVPQIALDELLNTSHTPSGEFYIHPQNVVCTDSFVLQCKPKFEHGPVIWQISTSDETCILNQANASVPCQNFKAKCIYLKNGTAFTSEEVFISRELCMELPTEKKCGISDISPVIFSTIWGGPTNITWYVNGERVSTDHISGLYSRELTLPCSQKYNQTEISYTIEYPGGEVNYTAGFVTAMLTDFNNSKAISNCTEPGKDDSNTITLPRAHVIIMCLSLSTTVVTLVIAIVVLLVRIYKHSESTTVSKVQGDNS